MKKIIQNMVLASVVSLVGNAYGQKPVSDAVVSTVSEIHKRSNLGPANFPITKGTAWNYLDDGTSLDGVAWKDASFDDSSWEQGVGVLGYGDAEATTISYGPNPNNRIITSYFRRSVSIDLATLTDNVILGVLRDDAAVIYVNGEEIRRDNLPAGAITSNTFSSSIISGADETKYFITKVPKSKFIDGINQIAVEVHNRDETSSDFAFDMYLKSEPVVAPVTASALGCENGNENHISCFTSIDPTAQTRKLIIPSEYHRFQILFKEDTKYSVGSGRAPGSNDFAGYVALEGSSELGHLSINHEQAPGGVSLLDVSYDDVSKLWSVDTSRAVDMYNADLVNTSTNCSGGITPWGTIVTSEEYPAANGPDQNGDGYKDIGWLVEIDPITSKVIDHDGDGKQDKLWACGRFSHENAVILKDSVTLYAGEDGGSSAVFKFVADTKGDLSEGSLYVLKLDDPFVNREPTGSTATWVKVPNTTKSDRNNTTDLAKGLRATSFNGVEDVEVHPLTGQIYFAAKGSNRVYRFTDNGATISDFETFVGGKSYKIKTKTGVHTEPWADGNDNLTFDDKGTLWVLQDGGKNYIWTVRTDHTQQNPKVELFASFPAGSEPTGLTFSPDFRFGFVSVQHPSSSNVNQLDATKNQVKFDRASTFVFSRSEHLGAQAPVASFTSDVTTVSVGGSVVFTDESENSPTVRNWKFNGGVPAVSTNEVETVTYAVAGLYEVELVVSNEEGEDAAIIKEYIKVIEPAPVSHFTADLLSVNVGDEVVFSDASTNHPTSFDWTFVGGTPATSQDASPVVTYAVAGDYPVTLVASNETGEGSVETINSYIHVADVASPTGINDNDFNENIVVFPNPTSGVVTLSMDFKGGEQVVVELYTVEGKRLAILSDSEATAGHKDSHFDLSSYVGTAQSVVLKVTVDENEISRFIEIIK